MTENLSRRRLVFGVAGFAGLSNLSAAAGRDLTPAATPGPFYPQQYPLDGDADLTTVQGVAERAKGQHIWLAGTVFDTTGAAQRRVQVEIWQCDANGRYHHRGDRGTTVLDRGFQGWGRTLTDDGGAYRFRTIVPVPYPGRTPHIHFLVQAGDRRLVTQMYLRGAIGNESDWLFNRMSPAARERVLVAVEQGTAELPKARFDIVIEPNAS